VSLKQFRRLRKRKKPPTVKAPRSHEEAPSVEIVPVVPSGLERLETVPRLGPDALLRHFLQGRSPNTLAAYKRDLAAFADWMGFDVSIATAALLQAPPGNANALVLDWANQMADAGLASSTRSRRLGTLRSLTKLARMLGVITWSLDVQGPRVQTYRDTRGPALEAIHKMLATCGEDHEGLRNRVIILLLAALGLRRTEVITIRLRDYEREERRVRVMGKGAKEVWITLPDPVRDALDAWLSVRPAVPDAAVGEAPLVCSLAIPGTGSALSRQGLNWIVREIGKKAGVKAWPHGLRHAGITLGLDSHDVRHVRRFSRHANVQTVMIYDDNREDLGARVAETVANKLTKKEMSRG
jgi:integrase/recombinase XerC